MMSTENAGILERKARIFNVQKYSIYDGPGIRTLIFFKGCPLRCRWCSNPEGLERKYQVMYKEDACIHCGCCVSVCPSFVHRLADEAGGSVHRIQRGEECVGCRRCEEICPKNALSIAGCDRTISEVLEIIQQDALFYLSSGGGITLGGGEATGQSEFAVNLLMECRQMGIHTAVETCGYAKLETLLAMGEFTDLFLYDLKHIDPKRHYELTGVPNERILSNLGELIRRGYSVKVRMPLMKGLNSDEETIRRTMEFLQSFRKYKNFQGIDLLPYHKLGVNKYKQLDLEYPLAEAGDISLREDDLAKLERIIAEYSLPAKIIRH